jgi:hypothetical protein
MRDPGSSSAEARPAPFSSAHLAISPSRLAIGLQASITTFPLSSPPRSFPTLGSAWYGTATSSTSPNAAAWRGVPALAFAPTSAASFLSWSRSSEENMTECPAPAQMRPSVPPMRPEPMMPILVLPACALATRAANGRPLSTSVAPVAPRNPRRFLST